MPFDWGQLGMQAASGAIGTGMGLLLEDHNDKRQLKQQGKLQELEIKGQKEMGDYNLANQMKLWEQTNYKAQMEQMKKTGLNPALMYGIGGPGGSTAANTGSVTGGHAPSGGHEAIETTGMGMQLALMAAQKANIEADTQNKLADLPNKPLQGANIQASTQNLLQGVENQKAQQILTQAQTQIAEAAAKVANATIEEQIQAVTAAMAQAQSNVEIAEQEVIITKATAEAKIKMLKAQAIGAVLENKLTQAKTELTGEQTKNTTIDRRNIGNKLGQWAAENMIELQKLSLEERRTRVAEQLKDSGLEMQGIDEITNIIGQMVDGLFRHTDTKLPKPIWKK